MRSQDVWLFIIVLALVLTAFIFAWRQTGTLRWLQTQDQMPREERQYYRWRSYRWLFGCLLLLALAVQLGGLSWFGVLEGLDRLEEAAAAAKENDLPVQGVEGRATPEQKETVRFLMTYVGGIALVVFVLLIIAFVDIMATRRYGMRQRKRIRDDRQAMLARQLPLLRRERNGPG